MSSKLTDTGGESEGEWEAGGKGRDTEQKTKALRNPWRLRMRWLDPRAQMGRSFSGKREE
jgi:hypothetical protein